MYRREVVSVFCRRRYLCANLCSGYATKMSNYYEYYVDTWKWNVKAMGVSYNVI